MEKNEAKHIFSSIGIISVLLPLALCLMFLLPVWNTGSEDQKEFTMHRAESLAYQIIEVRVGTERAPASAAESALNHLSADEGRIGLDSWGRPFRFKVLKSKSEASKVIVWSLGPNGSSENEIDSSQFDLSQNNGPVSLVGDDLGIMLSIN